MLNIQEAQYAISAVNEKDFPNKKEPEFLFMGRSNVGKSTFINALTNRKKLAYTSSTPGKTQTLNFYYINESFYFVDVPGYGYAKVSKDKRAQFGEMIEHYLTSSKNLRRAFLLVDFRHGPSVDDVLMFDYLAFHEIPTTIIATKHDKVRMNDRKKADNIIRKKLINPKKPLDLIIVSSDKRYNIDKVLMKIESNINHG